MVLYLINFYAKKELLLACSISSLYDRLRDFVVYVNKEEEILGVCALHITWENLAEIRSLAVREGSHGRGIGRKLVQQCLNEAEMFALILIPSVLKFVRLSLFLIVIIAPIFLGDKYSTASVS